MASANVDLVQSTIPGPAGGQDRGAWVYNTTYTYRDIVTANGSGYWSAKPSQGVNPQTDDGTTWVLMVMSGADIANQYPVSGGTY